MKSTLRTACLMLAMGASPAIANYAPPSETEASDKAWEQWFDIPDNACHLMVREPLHTEQHDIYAEECTAHYTATPFCISYKNFADVWYEMRDGPYLAAMDDAGRLKDGMEIIDRFGRLPRKGGDPNHAYDADPVYKKDMREIYVAAMKRPSSFKSKEAFAAGVYQNCLRLRLLPVGSN